MLLNLINPTLLLPPPSVNTSKHTLLFQAEESARMEKETEELGFRLAQLQESHQWVLQHMPQSLIMVTVLSSIFALRLFQFLMWFMHPLNVLIERWIQTRVGTIICNFQLIHSQCWQLRCRVTVQLCKDEADRLKEQLAKERKTR